MKHLKGRPKNCPECGGQLFHIGCVDRSEWIVCENSSHRFVVPRVRHSPEKNMLRLKAE